MQKFFAYLNLWIFLYTVFHILSTLCILNFKKLYTPIWHAWIQRGDRGSRPPLKNHKNKGFVSNTGPDPLKNHKAANPAFNVGPPSARQRNAILIVFRLWANDGRLVVVLGSYLPSSTKNKQKNVNLDPLWHNFLDPHMFENSEHRDQMASLEASWSGLALVFFHLLNSYW